MGSTTTAATGTTRAFTGTKRMSPGMASLVTIRNTKHMGCTEPRHSLIASSMRHIYRNSKGKGGKAKGKDYKGKAGLQRKRQLA
jgi:hypothetical protein